MSVLALLDQDVEVSVRDGAVVVLRGGQVIRTLPRHEITEVQLYGNADLSAAARNFFLKEGLDVLFFTRDGRYRGRLVSIENQEGERRLCQYKFVCDPVQALALSTAMIHGKLQNQYDLLYRRQRRLRDPLVADVLAQLRRLIVLEAGNIEVLRGLEGAGAASYFGVWPVLLSNPVFVWNGRNRRPPKDPVNACLSFGYALLVSKVESVVRRVGLDPHLGVLHSASRGKPALVLDLAEEFRPLVDDLVLRLVNRQQLHPEDFQPGEEEGSVFMGEVARSILLREWALLLQSRFAHPGLEQAWALEALFEAQAHQLRRVMVEGGVYQPARLWA